MELLVQLLRFVNVFAAAVVGGGQLCVLLVIVPTKRQFSTRTSVEVHNAMLGHQIDYYMKPSGITSGLTAIALILLGAFQAYPLPAVSLVFYGLGLLGTAGVVITSRYFNVPMNRMMLTWDLDKIPENYPELRKRWDTVHTIRASCGLWGFACYLIAVLAAIPAPATGG
ncbi:MAG TPA: DUF1772 domain-containing protein [Gemmataceae bacterium]|jgi:hypothetical protein|nr:DUF1772 domain-containing protein [Gemmataceae bacterium]